jgi:hypothetical protein
MMNLSEENGPQMLKNLQIIFIQQNQPNKIQDYFS